MRRIVGFMCSALWVACSSTPPPQMPVAAEVDDFDMAETAEWVVASLCGDVSCRGERTFRYQLTDLNQVRLENCTLTLNRRGLRRPATIPLVEVWAVAARTPSLTDGIVAIRWWAEPERDAWFLEDRENRTSNAGWQSEPGSAIYVIPILGPRASEDARGIERVLWRAVDLCQA